VSRVHCARSCVLSRPALCDDGNSIGILISLEISLPAVGLSISTIYRNSRVEAWQQGESPLNFSLSKNVLLVENFFSESRRPTKFGAKIWDNLGAKLNILVQRYFYTSNTTLPQSELHLATRRCHWRIVRAVCFSLKHYSHHYVRVLESLVKRLPTPSGQTS